MSYAIIVHNSSPSGNGFEYMCQLRRIRTNNVLPIPQSQKHLFTV